MAHGQLMLHSHAAFVVLRLPIVRQGLGAVIQVLRRQGPAIIKLMSIIVRLTQPFSRLVDTVERIAEGSRLRIKAARCQLFFLKAAYLIHNYPLELAPEEGIIPIRRIWVAPVLRYPGFDVAFISQDEEFVLHIPLKSFLWGFSPQTKVFQTSVTTLVHRASQGKHVSPDVASRGRGGNG